MRRGGDSPHCRLLLFPPNTGKLKWNCKNLPPPKNFFLQIFNISGFKGLIYIYYITFKLIISHLTWFSQMLAKELKFALCHSNILQLKKCWQIVSKFLVREGKRFFICWTHKQLHRSTKLFLILNIQIWFSRDQTEDGLNIFRALEYFQVPGVTTKLCVFCFPFRTGWVSLGTSHRLILWLASFRPRRPWPTLSKPCRNLEG